MKLSTFILENMEPILQGWEDFASTIHLATHVPGTVELRNHAEEMLKTIAADLETTQNTQESIDKSHGLAVQHHGDSAPEVHAAMRLSSGFTIEQLMAEYRALRASVLLQWRRRSVTTTPEEMDDMIRFNEALDQAITESIARYSLMLRQSQNLFLAILGHDVRTPLGVIMMGAEVLLHDDTLQAKSLKTAARIQNSSERVASIVSDLLDFATTHLGEGIPVSPTSTDMAAICDDVVDELRVFYAERTILLETYGDLHGTWDGARIGQAISNLIVNALQHGADTSPVRIKVNGEPEQVELAVHNGGEMISPDALKTIFDPVKRHTIRPVTERTNGQMQNLGLGLYITREIVAAHSGKIDIESTKETGTTFTIRIPRNVERRNFNE